MGVPVRELREVSRTFVRHRGLRRRDEGALPARAVRGQRQRVAIARAFIARPELVVADEPTSRLDASLRSEVLDLMAGIRERLGTAFVLITHDLAAARVFAHRVAVMRRGKVVEEGPIERVLSAPAHEYTQVLLAASEGRVPEE